MNLQQKISLAKSNSVRVIDNFTLGIRIPDFYDLLGVNEYAEHFMDDFKDKSFEKLKWDAHETIGPSIEFQLELFPFSTLYTRVNNKRIEVEQFVVDYLTKLPAEIERLKKEWEEE